MRTLTKPHTDARCVTSEWLRISHWWIIKTTPLLQLNELPGHALCSLRSVGRACLRNNNADGNIKAKTEAACVPRWAGCPARLRVQRAWLAACFRIAGLVVLPRVCETFRALAFPRGCAVAVFPVTILGYDSPARRVFVPDLEVPSPLTFRAPALCVSCATPSRGCRLKGTQK